MKNTKNASLRLLFERHYGSRVSDATWYRVKKIFTSDFPMTQQNLIWVAEVKRQLPKCDLRFACVIESVRRTQKLFLENSTSISGEKLLTFLDDRDIKVHANTLTKWFKPLHGFRRTRVYTAQELKPVILAAFAYKLRKENVETVESLVKF